MPTRASIPTGAISADDITALCDAFLKVRTTEEARRFLRDLTTPGELQALAERWRVAQLLNAGEKSYRDISAETGVSTTTVTRVARFLSQEDHQGYRLVLDRMENDL
ncbi:YerC/YecD family TrpR-related protein [Maricaulaceae bacterium NA33B04]|nr:YerC/YecD family TrpR-related protein [Maricaulaceae bacterium NA33B04]